MIDGLKEKKALEFSFNSKNPFGMMRDGLREKKL
jgi:hypothetical protein